MKLALLLSVALTPLAFAGAASAAETPAVVAEAPVGEILYGRVYGANGEGLPGAEVVVVQTGRRAVTDAQGAFNLSGLNAGSATLEVRYLGLPTATQPVTVAAGAPTTIEITVGSGASGDQIEDVVVTGVITDGIARSLNQQRNAAGTLNVLSADAIGRYPDPNVAESLQRVQGIAIQRDQGEGRYINVRGAPSSFTAVSVDGVAIPAVSPTTRAVDLDTLPSDIVSSVEVSKTLSPAQDADSIAGAVNINTRSPFDSRGLALSAYAGGSYNDYGGSDTRAGATASTLFGPDETFGALISLSYSETNRRPDNVENAWNFNAALNRYVIDETLFKDYETQRTRQALTGALEWRPNDSSRAWVRGSFAEFNDNEYRDTLRFTYSDGTIAAGATNSSATFTNARIYKALRHREQNNQITTLNGGAEHTFGNGAILDATLAFARSEQTYPHRDELVYRSGAQTLSYDTTDHYSPTYSAFASTYYSTPANYSFRENTFRSNTTEQRDVSFKFNLELPTVIGGRDVTWRLGGKMSTRNVFADEERYRDRTATAPVNPGALMPLLSDRESRNYGYALGFKFDHDLVSNYLDQIRALSTNAASRRIPQSWTADYTADEEITAGYGQAQFDIGATNVLVGLRVENTDFKAGAFLALATTAVGNVQGYVQSPIAMQRDRTDFFPNLTLRHGFSDALIGRFALTRAISRPDYVDVVPRILETTDGGRTTVSRGNPNLEATLSNNVDAGLEYYLRPLGVISVNAFYKDLEDFRYTLVYDGPYTTSTGTVTANITEALNAPEGHIAGVEFNWQQTFEFLPGWASGFGVFANYTLTDAEIETATAYAGRTTFILPGQSDETYNAALFYENYGFSARVSYTHRGDFLEAINATNAGLDLYVEGRGQLDFTTSYDFGNGLEVFGEAKNLTDSAGVRYYGSQERTYEYEKFGYNVFMGVRFKL
ncbi:TonB-dependent receptor [Brevundimonas sp.]|uniref:TonB-dependent receptor n=1 Tax=Brevundimonas sp. TaxID=1871086 RepID=UPI003D0AA262